MAQYIIDCDINITQIVKVLYPKDWHPRIDRESTDSIFNIAKY